MSYWVEKLEKLIDEGKKQETELEVQDITDLPLSKFAGRNLAFEIYSNVLKCNIWFCSNKDMVKQLKKDNPEAICYTTEELRNLIDRKATNEELKQIYTAKSVFPNSTLKEIELNRDSEE